MLSRLLRTQQEVIAGRKGGIQSLKGIGVSRYGSFPNGSNVDDGKSFWLLHKHRRGSNKNSMLREVKRTRAP